jgi:hypothetical protein
MILIDEFARTTPVNPPIVNRNTDPSDHRHITLCVSCNPYAVASHLKVLRYIYEGKSISKLQMDIEVKQIRVLI